MLQGGVADDGITHAAGLSCKSSGVPAPMGDTCIVDRDNYQLPQYADPFDAMGNRTSKTDNVTGNAVAVLPGSEA